MIFAWWMACLSDAYASAYYRRKPQVEEDDYDVDFYIVDPVTVDADGQTKPGPREQLEVRPVLLSFPLRSVLIYFLLSFWYAFPKYDMCAM